ncbi:MAG TPA: hypothetical protein VFW98_03070 [Gemmatimonadaceae bacterium]|nr:hypothetical protein [Gemmatimonadaceae bacterium]
MDFAIVSRLDVFRDAPQASSAAAFGTLGITFRARRAAEADEWRRTLEALTCGVAAPPGENGAATT